jgi:uncharacterized protein (TIGR02231 family)
MVFATLAAIFRAVQRKRLAMRERRFCVEKKSQSPAHHPASLKLGSPTMIAIKAALSLAALCAAAPALAGEIDAASRIDAVTLYPDAAAVTRIAEIELPAGASRLVFRGLPAGIDPTSLRVSGEGDAKILLGAIEVKKAPAPIGDGALSTQLKTLHAQRDSAQVKLDALAAKQAMTLLYSKTGPEKLGGEDKGLKPEDWGQAWDVVGAALAKVGEDLRVARAGVAELDDQIKTLEPTRPLPSPRGPAQDVTIDIEAPASGKMRLSLNYRIAGASWTPAYDARLETGGQAPGQKAGKPHLELTRRAIISQTTGEDFTDVALSLAAFPAAGGTEAPQVEPQIIAFYEPPIAYRAGVVSEMAKAMPAASAPNAAPPPPLAMPERIRAVEAQSRLDAGAYQARFHAPGRVSLASGGTTKNISLTTQEPETALSWRISPALDPRAFLSAHFVNGEEAPLLPGAISIYRDGALIGQSHMPLVAPGEASDLGFGVDDRVTVLRAPVKRRENEPTRFGQTKTETREFKTLVRNLHDFPIKAVVTDQTPVSENVAIVVETLAQTTPPDEKAPDDKPGLLRWRFDLGPNESKELRLAFRMKWPADRDVVVP